MARAAAFGSRVIIMDEPTAALGVKEARRVVELILDVNRRGLPIILISHNMPHVFEVANRIQIMRLGRRIAVIDPKQVLDVGRGRDHDRRGGAAGGGEVGRLIKHENALMPHTAPFSVRRSLPAAHKLGRPSPRTDSQDDSEDEGRAQRHRNYHADLEKYDVDR